MKMDFYPYDFDYKVEDELTYFYCYAKLANGQKIAVKHRYDPYFYVLVTSRKNGSQKEDSGDDFLEKIKKIEVETDIGRAKVIMHEEVEKELLGVKKKFLKIYTNFPKAVPPIAKEVQLLGAECFEKDILFVHRYLRDNEITPMALISAEGEFLESRGILDRQRMKIPVFLAKKVLQESRNTLSSWKILAVDIETYSSINEINLKNPILMAALYGKDESGNEFKKVLTWKRFDNKLDYLEIVSDEVELLNRLKRIISDYQPDIITGYFSDGFDFPYIKARADNYKIKLDLGLDYSEMICGSDLREGEARIKGLLHLDVFKFIRNIFGKDLKTESFSLDAVSEELLNKQKRAVDISELAHVWDHQPEKLEDFCEYNLHDAHLAYELCSLLLPDMMEFAKIVGVPLFDVIRMRFSRLVEGYILKRAIEYNVIAPNRPGHSEISQRMEESIQGAFVFEPTPSLYKNIVVFDFRSLYPTIITAHNIGPEGFRCFCCKDSGLVPESDNYWFCQKEKKFLPAVLEQLILKRVDLKRLIKETKQRGENTRVLEARSYALKTLANSFYGYLGFYGARWYCLECAASTTAYARDYIKKTIKKAEEKGFKVIYADTDSCFLLLGDKILDQAMEFMNEINFELPGHMELEFEGNFPRGIFVAVKGSEKGAKKKYALITTEGNVKITGFESVRRNWSPLAKEVQEKVLKMILQDKEEEALQYLKKVVMDLKSGKINLSKLIIKTQITRNLSQYTSFGPHVKVAHDLIQRGENVLPGTVVEYIIVKGSGLVRTRAKIPTEVEEGRYDAEYYLNHQLIPAVSSIFSVLGYTEEQIFQESTQTGLGKFM
ncbi:MAG: DNA-directed DNA polymerase [Nanoarchaeota archaeon]